jgi:two-component system, OmpR family, sensor histidine kinase MtrB
LAIRVRDHGVGFSAADSERVFDRFWRADPSRSRATGGTGLGLSIALEDARLHDGQLAGWGRPGEGASFRLLLPRRAGGTLGTSPLALISGTSLARTT